MFERGEDRRDIVDWRAARVELVGLLACDGGSLRTPYNCVGSGVGIYNSILSGCCFELKIRAMMTRLVDWFILYKIL